MAYAESTIGGSMGGQFRVWINSIRTYDGSPAENFEEWRAEGGINRVAGGGRVYNGYGNSTFTVQLGLNGMAASGRFSYDYGGGTGRMNAWGTGTTRVYRDGAGNGFGFQSRMDVNLQNGPYLTSGWVVSNDGLVTRYRHAQLTALSMDAGGVAAYDEGPMWLEFWNPSGAAVDAFIDDPLGRAYTSPPAGSRFNFPFDASLIQRLQQSSPNSNTFNINIGIHDNVGGDSYDYRTRTVTIKNDLGQANPSFSDFDFLDTNAATVAITGSNQVLIQGLSTLQINIPTSKRAYPNKFATMSSYNTTVGGYVNNLPYSNSATVTDNVGPVSDVTGVTSISVRAIDSRGNSTTAYKTTTILPYAAPMFTPSLLIAYTNNYDNTGGLKATVASGSTIAVVSPMTLNGTDKNAVVAASGVQYDISKNGNTNYTGTYTNVPTTYTAGSGTLTANLTTLATSILGRMNTIGADNTVRWYIKFKVTDKVQTVFYETYIDVGKAIFRIGVDGKVYNQEQALMPSHIGMVLESTTLVNAAAVQAIYGGTWATFGAGRVLVGYDSSDTDFNAPSKTGGQKTVQAHSHKIWPWNDDFNNSAGGVPFGTTMDGSQTKYQNNQFETEITGTGATNMNPYIVVYRYVRTA